jgi:hypothetical protein
MAGVTFSIAIAVWVILARALAAVSAHHPYLLDEMVLPLLSFGQVKGRSKYASEHRRPTRDFIGRVGRSEQQ